MEYEYIMMILIAAGVIFLISKGVNSGSDSEVKYFPYKKKFLLTKAEYYFYNELKSRIQKYNIIICPKVRMEDFIDVTDEQNRQKFRGYIKSRHVDFLLCDAKLNIIGAIELDDPSHNYASVQKADRFKDNVYKAIDIKLYRITYKEDYDRQINAMLKDIFDRNKDVNRRL